MLSCWRETVDNLGQIHPYVCRRPRSAVPCHLEGRTCRDRRGGYPIPVSPSCPPPLIRSSGPSQRGYFALREHNRAPTVPGTLRGVPWPSWSHRVVFARVFRIFRRLFRPFGHYGNARYTGFLQVLTKKAARSQPGIEQHQARAGHKGLHCSNPGHPFPLPRSMALSPSP